MWIYGFLTWNQSLMTTLYNVYLIFKVHCVHLAFLQFSYNATIPRSWVVRCFHLFAVHMIFNLQSQGGKSFLRQLQRAFYGLTSSILVSGTVKQRPKFKNWWGFLKGHINYAMCPPTKICLYYSQYDYWYLSRQQGLQDSCSSMQIKKQTEIS